MNPTLPDKNGHFGVFGGRYAAETLMPALLELEKAYESVRKDKIFNKDFEGYQREYSGRPTPLYYARRMTEALRGAKIYLKREDLNHTGSHKINNTLGQALLAPDGQEKSYRRNRSRTARRRHSHGRRALRYGM